MVAIAGSYPKYQKKCGGCGKPITEEEELLATYHGNRLWHDECWNGQKEYEEIFETAQKYLGEVADKNRIYKQVREMVAKGRKISGIKLSLDYWYGKQGGDTSKAHGGIAIVDYIYEQAAQDYRERMDKTKKQIESVKADGPHDNFLNLRRKVPTQILKRTNLGDKNMFHLD